MEGASETFGPISAYLVNFVSPIAHPRCFTYHACTQIGDNGRMCSKTIEGPYKCGHLSMDRGTWTEQYRFDVILVDCSVGEDCPPLRAAVFDAGMTLLGGRTPEAFALLDEDVQVSTVREVIDALPYVEVIVRVHKGSASIQRLLFIRPVTSSPKQRSTPRQSQRSRLKPSAATSTQLGSKSTEPPCTSTRITDEEEGSIARSDFDNLKARVREMEILFNNMEVRRA